MTVLGIKKKVIRPEQIESVRRGVKRYDFDAIDIYDPEHPNVEAGYLAVEGEKDCRNALQRMRAYNRDNPKYEVRAIVKTEDDDGRPVYVEFARQRAPWTGDRKRTRLNCSH